MAEANTELPDDIEKLKAIIKSQQLAFQTQLIDKERQILWEREKYRALERRFFGKSSEKKAIENDPQYFLFDEAEVHAEDPVTLITAVAAHQRNKSGRKQKNFSLPVKEELHV